MEVITIKLNGRATKGDGKMIKLTIDNKEYEIEDEVSDLIVMISKERDGLKETLKADKEPVANVFCSEVLSDVLKLLENDLKINQRLADKYKAKADKEMMRQFQLKRRHTRDIIKQIEALGR